MSDAIFPELPGLTWNREKNPEFNNIIQTAANGNEKAVMLWVYPKWYFKLSYECLRAGEKKELEQIVGFFLQRRGNFDTFLYRDPNDYQVTNQPIGVGDGTTKECQLARNFGGFIEPVWGVINKPVITVGGVSVDFTFDTRGLIAFNAPPAAGDQIRVVSCDFYYRVRFVENIGQFNEFVAKLWEARSIEFVTSKRR